MHLLGPPAPRASGGGGALTSQVRESHLNLPGTLTDEAMALGGGLHGEGGPCWGRLWDSGSQLSVPMAFIPHTGQPAPRGPCLLPMGGQPPFPEEGAGRGMAGKLSPEAQTSQGAGADL